MKNSRAAVQRRLADPEFQGWILHKSILLNLLFVVLVTVSIGRDAFKWFFPQQPIIFVKNASNVRPLRMDIISSPVEDQTELTTWTAKAMLKPYNVNYYDFPTQLNEAGKSFTYDGWKSFGQNYIDIGNFEKMKKARMHCFAIPKRSAIIKKQEIVEGRRNYTIVMPIVQTCENTNDKNTQDLMLTAVVIRVNDQDHPDGVAIDLLVAKPNTDS